MEKFQGKYRIPSNRLPGWNYASNGMYFLTVVVQNRECILGDIKNGMMQLSEFGKIVDAEWQKSFEMRSELFLDEYIIMPNHFHAIVIIDAPELDGPAAPAETDARPSVRGRHINQSPESPPENPLPANPRFYRQPKSISSFMAGFKSAINSKIDDYIDEYHLNIPKYNRNNHFFQPNYHDHIIRNEEEYWRIKNYIINNPKNWEADTMKKPEITNNQIADK